MEVVQFFGGGEEINREYIYIYILDNMQQIPYFLKYKLIFISTYMGVKDNFLFFYLPFYIFNYFIIYGGSWQGGGKGGRHKKKL